MKWTVFRQSVLCSASSVAADYESKTGILIEEQGFAGVQHAPTERVTTWPRRAHTSRRSDPGALQLDGEYQREAAPRSPQTLTLRCSQWSTTWSSVDDAITAVGAHWKHWSASGRHQGSSIRLDIAAFCGALQLLS